MAEPAFNTVGLLRFPALLAQYSIEPLDFLSRRGIKPNIFAQAGGWLPRDLCLQVADEAAKATGDPAFTAKVGASTPLTELGEFGQRVAAAPTLGEALVRAQNAELVQQASLFRLETDPSRAVFHIRFLGTSKADPQQFLLGTLAAARNIVLLAGEPDGVSVRLTTQRSAAWSGLEEHLGDRLEFGARDDAVIVDRSLLDLPIFPRRKALEPMPIAVARQILKLLPQGQASLRNVARRLSCSERTVQRQLAEHGVTFKNLLDVTRRDEAIELVRNSNLSFARIAQEVGYSDQANFNNAFNRWTGTTPTGIRAGSELPARH